MKCLLRLDWATMNFAPGTISRDELSELLAGSVDTFCWRKKGLSDNSPEWSPLGLRYVHNNGYASLPHKLEVSGVGCRKFLYTLPRLRSDSMRFSRLDFAFDVIMRRDAWKSFLGKCFAESLFSDRQRKRFKLQGDGEAMTVYIGSRISPKYFRIYNKTLQDRKYEYRDGDGQLHDLAENECVIRYEVELHRYKSTGKCNRIFDPSPCFDWFFSGDQEDHDRLHREILRMWESFGNEILLPPDFESLELVDLTQTEQNRKFCSIPDDAETLVHVQEALQDYPHSFDRTLEYVAERFGRYIPYILLDDTLRKACFDSCELHFGFVPDLYIEQVKQYNFCDDLEDAAPDVPLSWVEHEQEDQCSIDPDEFGRRCNQWSF